MNEETLLQELSEKLAGVDLTFIEGGVFFLLSAGAFLFYGVRRTYWKVK